ncbi:proline oxidase-like protein [Calycina marina]|uniref:Proline dehydrogenase n=1 Tax=Calycina marina TaxID=1763456 RepID=A0A9P7ZCN5_9HELO|nr:proline oxidase-like protein [Calycina marina]
MNILAHTKSPILSPDSNPLLRKFLKKTFYAQFCAGENEIEVKKTMHGLKAVGFDGVILCFAKEVVLDAEQKANLATCVQGEAAERSIREEVTPWAEGTLETVRLTNRGDFVALKFTGAGSQALYTLLNKSAPPPALKEAIDAVCELAASRGVRLLFDAENNAVQPGIDAWTLDYMKKYNTPTKAVVYGTYQAYLKSAPSLLASHLAVARKENYVLGVKLVRGAYIGSDPRHLIHDTKSDTDACYDGIAEALTRRTYTAVLPPAASEDEQPFPVVDIVLAGHNQASNRKNQAIRAEQAERGEERVNLVYAQLQGMADEVSCELVQKAHELKRSEKVDIPSTYKYLVWGTTGECMKYLLRRAQENKDAVQRTRESRNAMAGELGRRVKSYFWFA